MWSDNKKVDYLINTLIFLVAINFMHYGQLFLPIICLILFIDNKFKFKVNNIKIFVVLCLFAISFCYFSYELGFYCVMGFTLPMAYYIGSNIIPSKENVKKIIYLVSCGMALHIILNFVYDLYVYGLDIVNHQSRYDFWLREKVSPTGTATNYVFIIGSIYYIAIYETNKKTKLICAITFLLSFSYDIFLGRRTPVFIFVIVIALLVLFDKENIKKIFYYTKYVFPTIIILIMLVHITKVIGINDIFGKSLLISKFKNNGLYSGRLELLVKAIKIAPFHLFGGKEISLIIGEQIHDLWFDIYDYSGIIPFILIIIYTVFILNFVLKILKTKSLSKEYKILVLGILICSLLQFMLEPIMTGASILIICFVLLMSCIERQGSK